MCNFFDKRGYPASVVQAGHHRAQQIDRQSAPQTSQKENNNRIPFTLTFHPHNHAVKSIILKNFKLLQNDPDTGRIFSQPPLISFKRDKNIGNFLVSSAFKTIACRTGVIFCVFQVNIGESEVCAKRELRTREGALKIPPVVTPLFKLFQPFAWRTVFAD